MFLKAKNAEPQENEYDIILRNLHGVLLTCMQSVRSCTEKVITANGVNKLFEYGSFSKQCNEQLQEARNRLYDELDAFTEAQTKYNEYLIQNQEKLCTRKLYIESKVTGYNLVCSVYHDYYNNH